MLYILKILTKENNYMSQMIYFALFTKVKIWCILWYTDNKQWIVSIGLTKNEFWKIWENMGKCVVQHQWKDKIRWQNMSNLQIDKCWKHLRIKLILSGGEMVFRVYIQFLKFCFILLFLPLCMICLHWRKWIRVLSFKRRQISEFHH